MAKRRADNPRKTARKQAKRAPKKAKGGTEDVDFHVLNFELNRLITDLTRIEKAHGLSHKLELTRNSMKALQLMTDCQTTMVIPFP